MTKKIKIRFSFNGIHDLTENQLDKLFRKVVKMRNKKK